MEDRSRHRVENVLPDDSAEAPRPAQIGTLPAYSEWAGVGSGGGEDGDYNLEAFVSAETTLADHLAEQLALAITDPVRRMIGQYLIDMVDEAGYLAGDSRPSPRSSARRWPRSKRCCDPADASIRPASAPATSPNAWRSSSRSATASIRRCRRWSQISICWRKRDLAALRKTVRRRRRRSRRHDRRNPQAQSEAGPRLRLGGGAADRARRVRAGERRTAAGWSS